jgi:sialic acid synthase SpsE
VACIEKHYTLDRRAEGFDHAYAAEGEDFTGYVAEIRAAELALRAPAEKLGAAELYTRKRARRSLYAAGDLHAGETVRDEDVLVLRPENAMAADQIDEVVGRRLARDVRQFEPYTADMFSK